MVHVLLERPELEEPSPVHVAVISGKATGCSTDSPKSTWVQKHHGAVRLLLTCCLCTATCRKDAKKRKKKRRVRAHVEGHEDAVAADGAADSSHPAAPTEPALNGHRPSPTPAADGADRMSAAQCGVADVWAPSAHHLPAPEQQPQAPAQQLQHETQRKQASELQAAPRPPPLARQPEQPPDKPPAKLPAAAKSAAASADVMTPPAAASQQPAKPQKAAAPTAASGLAAATEQPAPPPPPTAEQLAQARQEAAREALEAVVVQASTLLDIGAAAGEETISRVLGNSRQPASACARKLCQ